MTAVTVPKSSWYHGVSEESKEIQSHHSSCKYPGSKRDSLLRLVGLVTQRIMAHEATFPVMSLERQVTRWPDVVYKCLEATDTRKKTCDLEPK
jgi:hypothetical protein